MKLVTRRILRGTRKQQNWLELAKFGMVGLSGYGVNLLVFTLLLRLDAPLTLAAVGAFTVALTNNFLWNRHWTFVSTDGRKRQQAPRFVVISLLAFGFNLAALHTLVAFGLSEISAQALSVAAAMPVNFVGNKLWTFERE